MIIEFDCVVCGTRVRKSRSPANTPKAPKYCSQKCHGVARTGVLIGLRVPRIEMRCENCGSIVTVYRSPAQREKQPPRFCSLQCLGEAQKGEANPSYSGGRHLLNTGYVAVLAPDHHLADCRGYVLEHRLVAEKMIGRPLHDGEVVHHLDGDTTNNDDTNLRVYPSHSEHMREEHSGRFR